MYIIIKYIYYIFQYVFNSIYIQRFLNKMYIFIILNQ
jgi:hypothetical protein